MLEIGIDETTIVLQADPNHAYNKCMQWELLARVIINTFAERADFFNILGPKVSEEKAPAGYTKAYHYGSHNFYLALAYHPDQKKMGVVVKFSAQALDYYLQHRNIQFYELIHDVADKMYSTRLSRVDLTADYVDENVDTTAIYKDLIARNIDIFDKFDGITPDKPIYRRRGLKYRGYCDGDEIPTIYIGSPKSDLELRIYNKKQEQISRNGSKLERAISCHDWTRFELILRGNYAHQISDAIKRIETDIEFANLISSTFVQRFRFMKIEDGSPEQETYYTQMLIDCINSDNFKLRANVHKNYDLIKNIEYLFQGSGILTTLHKIYAIWGCNAVWELLWYTLDLIENYEPNNDCSKWVQRNANDYLEDYPIFEDFLKCNLPQIRPDRNQAKGLRKFDLYANQEKGKKLSDSNLVINLNKIMKQRRKEK